MFFKIGIIIMLFLLFVGLEEIADCIDRLIKVLKER